MSNEGADGARRERMAKTDINVLDAGCILTALHIYRHPEKNKANAACCGGVGGLQSPARQNTPRVQHFGLEERILGCGTFCGG